MTRAYSVLAYATYLAASGLLIWFVEFGVDRPAASGGTVRSIAIDALLLILFAAQHSLMARPRFKRTFERWMSPLALRSAYVLLSSLAVGALCGLWRPLPGRLWELHGVARSVVFGISVVGWLIVMIATAQVDPWLGLGGRTAGPLRIRGLFRLVRHPTYLGLLIVFWSAETMTWTHLLFSAGVSLYVVLAVPWEERDLVATFGDAYADYRRRVPAIAPFPRCSTESASRR